MSAAEELEEGEITSSEEGEIADSPTKEKVFSRRQQTSSTPSYSIFDNQPQKPLQATPFPQPPHRDSESECIHSNSDDDDCDNIFKKKLKFQSSEHAVQQQSFTNPNFVKSGGVMPPLPKSKKNIWGSVLEEQILTASVCSFNMKKKIDNDRDVESYDFTRAKEDDRPHLNPVEEKIKDGSEDDIFGEVVDLEKAAFNQRRNMKRKHVSERIGKRKSTNDKPHLPTVSAKSSVEEVTCYISTMLQEAKVHLIRRVVTVLGQAKALEVLKKTEQVEAEGGMMVMNGRRRRTKGGVYLLLLKTKCDVPQEQVNEIFEEEEKQYDLERRRMKKKMAKARKRSQRQRNRQRSAGNKKKDASQSTMEVVGGEESNSRSSVEGQRGSPRHSGDHLSDTGDKEHLEEEVTDSSNGEMEDFEAQLAREVKRHAETKDKMLGGGGVKIGAGDGVTLDDVLDIAVDDDFLD